MKAWLIDHKIWDGAKRFVSDETGPTATEYAVCLSLIIIACFVAIVALGESTSELFPDLSGVIN